MRTNYKHNSRTIDDTFVGFINNASVREISVFSHNNKFNLFSSVNKNYLCLFLCVCACSCVCVCLFITLID